LSHHDIAEQLKDSSLGIYTRSWQGVLDTTLCDTVCQWLTTHQWFS